MELYEKLSMKDLLSEGLFILMQQKPFEKITIKQICDKTGVIRGTFYNHFMDKYEALEYLVHHMFYEGMENANTFEIIQNMFKVVDENRDFFVACFKIQGQNGFEDLMRIVLKDILQKGFEFLDFSGVDARFSQEFLLDYYANTTLYFIKYWIDHHFQPDYVSYCDSLTIVFKNNLVAFGIKERG